MAPTPARTGLLYSPHTVHFKPYYSFSGVISLQYRHVPNHQSILLAAQGSDPKEIRESFISSACSGHVWTTVGSQTGEPGPVVLLC